MKVTQFGLIEDDTIGTPPSGIINLYGKTDGNLYQKDSNGVETILAGGSGGGGTVTSVTSANADITIVNGTTNAVLTAVESPSTRALESATTTVNVSSAAAPTADQVLTATSSTTATWQTPTTSVGPSFSARLSAPQILATGGGFPGEPVEFDTLDWDTDSCFDTSNWDFTPNVAGYYMICVWIYGQATNMTYNTLLMKNGEVYYVDEGILDRTNTLISCLVEMNGTTDRLSVDVDNTSLGNLTLDNEFTFGSLPTYPNRFQGHFIRGL